MLEIGRLKHPLWFRPFLRSFFIRELIGYDHWSRAWEYPWAVKAAILGNNPLRTLDVGGGNSPFSDYLVQKGHSCSVIDKPVKVRSLIYKKKGIYRSVRNFILLSFLKLIGLNFTWGLPNKIHRPTNVKYYAYSASDIKFPDNYFDRVFCLSVLEHIPANLWKECMDEFQRVLKSRGRLIITLDMDNQQANNRQYINLINYCSLELVGNPHYTTPLTKEDQYLRHPGHIDETIGLVWQAKSEQIV